MDTLTNKDEGYLILQSAFAKESELCYLAETTIKRQGQRMPLVRIEYVAHVNGCEYRRAEYRRQNDGGEPIGIITVTNQYGNWRYTKEGIIRDCDDFIADKLFDVKPFEHLRPRLEEYRVLNKNKDRANDEYILVERLISGQDSLMMIRKLINIHARVMHTHLSDAGIVPKNETDNHDIVPIRAVYKISKNTGIIVEDSYFNKSGEYLVSTRQFDKVIILQSIPLSAFYLPKGLPFYFPGNSVDNWKFLQTL